MIYTRKDNEGLQSIETSKERTLAPHQKTGE